MPRSTIRQKACSAASPFSGESRGLRSSPEAVGSPYRCENGLTGGSPQELLSAPPTLFSHSHPHLQAGPPQVYPCSKRKGRWRMCASLLACSVCSEPKNKMIMVHSRMFYQLRLQSPLNQESIVMNARFQSGYFLTLLLFIIS